MNLALSLLGEIEVSLNGNVVCDLCAEKTQALLFYLAVESNRAHRREFLAEMFWPDNPPGYGRNSLKQALSQLKKALDDKISDTPYLISSKRDLQFNTGSNYWIDVLELDRYIQSTKTHDHDSLNHCETCIESLSQATELYRDDFLSDFYLPDSPDFNEWILTKREYYRKLIADSLNILISFHENRSEYKEATVYAKDLVELESWRESSHRKLMALLAASGKRSAALKQYQFCKSMLANEFDVQPTPETTALYESIKDWQVSKDPAPDAVSIPASEGQPDPATEPTVRPAKSLSTWIRVSALVSFLALAAILYLVFFRDSPIMIGSSLTGAETALSGEDNPTNFAAPKDNLDGNPSGEGDSDPQGSAAFLVDPGQACLEGEKLLYLEDFQDGQAQGWPEIEFKAQNWDIVRDPEEPDNLVAQNPGLHSTMVTYKGDQFQDAVFRVDFLPTGNTQPAFLWHSNNEPYREERGLVTNSDYSIGFMHHGTQFVRYTYPLPEASLHDGDYWINHDHWQQLEISTYEGMLRVWLNGEELLTYLDPNPLPGGSIGIGLGESLEEGSMVYFDNIRVCELSGPFVSIFDLQD